MLEKVKLALPIKSDAYNDDISQLISACKIDLGLAGINKIYDTDSLTVQAVIFYCKAYFRATDTTSERYKKAYENLKNAMALSGEYTEVVGDV